MNEKETSKLFRFSLYQEKLLLCEKTFSADQFNPLTRNSIDIRNILPKAITKLQKTLSRRNYDVIYETGRFDVSDPDSPNDSIDLFSKYKTEVNKYPKKISSELFYNPQVIVQQIEDKTIRGVECKIGFYVNENPIVERQFYVDGFNPIARWSLDLKEAVVDIADQIFNQIKNNDIKNMWDEYDLINYRGLSVTQIRELPYQVREDLLRKIKFN
jgi:hypothetical protein